MKLLTQEQGAALKAGDSVNVYWFSPRRGKAEPEPPSREWGGRQEWVDEVWANETVDSEPYDSACDGLLVKLKGRTGFFRVDKMEKP